MAKKVLPVLEPYRERAIAVGVEVGRPTAEFTLEDSLNELCLLARTAGIEVIAMVTQKLDRPNPQTYIGSGKLEEIKALVNELNANIILFDEELSPRHLRELEKHFDENVRIIDRTALILDIFAQHAHTHEGALQVELAQYEYRLPRLTRAWTHLARQAGGGGGRAGGVGGVGLRGPGETQLEADRRDIRRRIAHLKEELEKVRAHRRQYRRRRKKSGIPVAALVGYTNAGKSTLLNTLSRANVYVADQLFATLDPTTRRVVLPSHNEILLTDTVGFIQKLPAHLIAAFRATLEEIAEADILLHVLDISQPIARQQAQAVFQTLQEIGADHLPIFTVLNKIDLLSDPEQVVRMMGQYPNSVAISALTGLGTEELTHKLDEFLFRRRHPIAVEIPPRESHLVNLISDEGCIDRIAYVGNKVRIEGWIVGRHLAKYTPYLCQTGHEEMEFVGRAPDERVSE
ncbi:MAG: GTPase HflX [Anaerolineales bacterium]|nr:GTPase HflX [Anaerolineales bacterium]MDW8446879.1 GTPase HflX [Anaerolineales bacterium]